FQSLQTTEKSVSVSNPFSKDGFTFTLVTSPANPQTITIANLNVLGNTQSGIEIPAGFGLSIGLLAACDFIEMDVLCSTGMDIESFDASKSPMNNKFGVPTRNQVQKVTMSGVGAASVFIGTSYTRGVPNPPSFLVKVCCSCGC